MKKRIVWVAAVAAIAAGVSWTNADEPAKPEPVMPADMDPGAMMQAWLDAMTPNEHHLILEKMAGQFTYKMWWRMDPSMPPTESEGRYEGRMILGGRYLATQVQGNMMGEAFEGMGCLAYDNVLGKYVAAWIDNMGTGIMRSEGTANEDGNVITFEGEMKDPMTGHMRAYKFVYTIRSEDEFVMQWFSPPMQGGEMFEAMNLTYTRAK